MFINYVYHPVNFWVFPAGRNSFFPEETWKDRFTGKFSLGEYPVVTLRWGSISTNQGGLGGMDSKKNKEK